MPLSLKLLAGAVAGLALAASAGATLASPGQATASVNVRTGPGTSYPVVDTLYPGEDVDIGRCTGGWCYVRHSGADGWVSGRYLDDSYGDPYEPPPVYIERPPVYIERPPIYVTPPPIYVTPPDYRWPDRRWPRDRYNPPPQQPPPQQPPPQRPPAPQPPPVEPQAAPGYHPPGKPADWCITHPRDMACLLNPKTQ